MARKITKNVSSQNGKKTSSNSNTAKVKAVGTTLSKAKKRALIRRISSGPSEAPSDQRQRSSQPGPSNVRSGGRQGRPLAREPEELDEDEQDEEEEQGDSENEVLNRLEKFPRHRWYKALGKLFTMRIWPWPSSNWWIGDLDYDEEAVVMPRHRGLDPEEAKLAEDKKKLEAMVRKKFNGFLAIDMGMPAEEWMSNEFRSQVIFHTLPYLNRF